MVFHGNWRNHGKNTARTLFSRQNAVFSRENRRHPDSRSNSMIRLRSADLFRFRWFPFDVAGTRARPASADRHHPQHLPAARAFRNSGWATNSGHGFTLIQQISIYHMGRTARFFASKNAIKFWIFQSVETKKSRLKIKILCAWIRVATGSPVLAKVASPHSPSPIRWEFLGSRKKK